MKQERNYNLYTRNMDISWKGGASSATSTGSKLWNMLPFKKEEAIIPENENLIKKMARRIDDNTKCE